MSNELQLALRGNRPDYVLGTPLEGWDGPPVVRFTAREALGELFSYEVVLRRLADEGPFLAHRLLNGPATLRIATESRWREVHGIIAAVEEIERTAELTLFRVLLVPALYRATQRRRSRTFVDRTLRDILVALLENRSSAHPLGHGGLAEAAGSPSGAPPSFDAYTAPLERYRIDVTDPSRLEDARLRDYVVQYGESDFALLSRLLEEEGLSIVFDHDAEGSVVRITDHADTVPAHEADANVAWRSAFKGVGARDRESVRSLKKRARLLWGSVEVRDFDPARPQSTELGVALDTVSGPGGQTSDPDPEIFLDHRYPSRDEAVTPPCITPATLAQERMVVERSTHEGVGTHRGMTAGMRFWLRDDTGVRGEEELTITSVVIYATQLLPEDTALDDEPFGLDGRGHRAAIFENRFEVVPAAVAFRPALRTPRPRIDGVHTAIVTAEEVSDPPPEINRNDRGDVRLRFPWDERRDAGTPSSTWVRVSQGWAGAGYGHLFTPRVGQEVLVSYLSGDPDRPLVVGRVHDAIQPVEYDKPTISTIKTKSSPNSDGFNELRFDDDAGNEEVFLHAQRNLNEVVLANHSTSVGGDQSNSVGGNQSNSVSGNRTHAVKGTEGCTVNGARTHTVHADETVTVDAHRCTTFGSELHHVIGDRVSVIGGFERKVCHASRMTTVIGAETLAVVGTRSMVVTGSNDEEVGGLYRVASPTAIHSHADSLLLLVGGTQIQMLPGTIILSTGGGASIVLSGSEISISASTVSINGDGSVGITAGAIGLTASGDIDAAAAGTIKLNG